MISVVHVQFLEELGSVKVDNQVFSRWDDMPCFQDCLVWSSHIDADSQFSGLLRLRYGDAW